MSSKQNTVKDAVCAVAAAHFRDLLAENYSRAADDAIDAFRDCDPEGMFATTYGGTGQIFMHGQAGNFFGVLMPINVEDVGCRRLDGGALKHAVPSWIGGVK